MEILNNLINSPTYISLTIVLLISLFVNGYTLGKVIGEFLYLKDLEKKERKEDHIYITKHRNTLELKKSKKNEMLSQISLMLMITVSMLLLINILKML